MNMGQYPPAVLRRRLAATCCAGFLGMTGSLVAIPAGFADQLSEQSPPEPPGEVTQGMLADSVTRFDPERSITAYDVDRSIEELGDAESEEDNVIVLEADILFGAMQWQMSTHAEERIGQLVDEVPDGAEVAVHGHTDSRPMPTDHELDNQQLSENRAQAVADALANTRTDLELDVDGFGATQPAVTEDPDDPTTFAANRRVEIRFEE